MRGGYPLQVAHLSGDLFHAREKGSEKDFTRRGWSRPGSLERFSQFLVLSVS
jgi:hypothetical protein